MAEEAKPGRKYEKCDAGSLRMTMTELSCSAAELATTLGYSGADVVNRWLAEGQMPKVAAIACEALRRRHTGANTAKTYLVKVTETGKEQALLAVLAGLGLEYTDI